MDEKPIEGVYFVVDAETDGLYGDVWAIGAGVFMDTGGGEFFQVSFKGQVDPQVVTNTWVRENIVPHVDLPRYNSPRELRDAFWAFWMEWRVKVGGKAWADFGAPVEAGLFRACVADDPSREWDGPYPLHEVGTLLLAAGIDPDVKRTQFSGLQGLTEHDPFDDVRASFACMWHAMHKLHS